MKMDNWFKPAILILALIFMVIFSIYAFNGRYRSMGTENMMVLDTMTGHVYFPDGSKY
jgi:hypothetical protein